ncbi:MAG: hypothetical protein WB757_03280 [Candidatus Cybelea sp.]|jgi:hypothetical protein
MRSGWLCSRDALIIAAVALLTACAQHGAMLPGTSAIGGDTSQRVIGPNLTPPQCKGQKNAKDYASLTVRLSTQGGAFCIPAFGGFGGTVKYPSANPSVKLSLISSTTNYNDMPELGQGTAIFYLQLALASGTDFGKSVSSGGGLASQSIVPGNPYTIYGQAVIDRVKVNFGPCYVIATKSKYGGAIGGIGTLLKGESVPVAATGVIEIYSGQQTSTTC